ncbi:MAG: putative zinc-binding protein [Oscillospiraceae bacterium]|nr:putative zinc-binding protein [Oscillospiraceae bacterium]
MSKIKVIPCSGIGKVYGLMARETALEVTNKLCPNTTETVCLAHLVTGDESAIEKVKGCNCITIDGCPALCSFKSVELAGGIIKAKYRAVDEMRNHRGKNAGTATALTEDGWQIVDGYAEKIAEKAKELNEEEKGND